MKNPCCDFILKPINVVPKDSIKLDLSQIFKIQRRSGWTQRWRQLWRWRRQSKQLLQIEKQVQ